MDDILTIEEINARFADEWVLLVDFETDEQDRLRRGRVACHSTDRDVMYRRAIELKAPRMASHFTGKRKPGMVYLL